MQIVLLGLMLADGMAPMSENASIGPSESTIVSFGGKSTHLILDKMEIWRYFKARNEMWLFTL